MDPSEYFRDNAVKCLTVLSDRAPNAGTDAVETIIALDTAMPYTARDHKHALASWMQGRHDVWQDRIDEYKSNPTNEGLAAIAELAIREHTPHTQSDFDDLVECMYRFAINKTLIENELERRRNDNDER